MTNPTPHGQVPEALRLANYLDELADGSMVNHDIEDMEAAAAELRRLHAENEALRTQQPAPATQQAVVVRKIDRGFRWDGENLQHVPTLLLEFEPVPANSPCDAKGWQDRDAVADRLFSPTASASKEASMAKFKGRKFKHGDIKRPPTLRPCTACNGSGHYDSTGSPKCSACNGTGKQGGQHGTESST